MRSLEERFWEKVDKLGEDECWPWLAAQLPTGYGVLARGGQGVKKKLLLAHRVSYELHYGPIPIGKQVNHHCDNPPCVNPAHLYAGTMKDNSRDFQERGPSEPRNSILGRFRQTAHGEANSRAKLTEEQVREIRKKFDGEGLSITVLARQYRLSVPSMHKVVHRLTWKHVI